MTDWEKRKIQKREILFDRRSSCLFGLRERIAEADHLAVALWALDMAGNIACELSLRHPGEDCFFEAVSLSRAWAEGRVKMPEAKRAILRCHALAKKWDDRVDRALCHGVAQGCSAVHVETHALGLVFYELTAQVLQREGSPAEEIEAAVRQKIASYLEDLNFWIDEGNHLEKEDRWADFLVRSGKVNREKQLLEKERNATLG